MSFIQISFYDEVAAVRCPNNFGKFKETIAEKYFLDPLDVDELIIYYINDYDRISIMSDADFQQAIFQMNKEKESNKNHMLQIFLEVSEKSRLYQREFESSKLQLKESELEKEKTLEAEKLRQQELLRKEIEKKEKLLKEILEKERVEKEEKERLEKEKLIKEILEKERVEKEEKQRLLREERLEKERVKKERLEKERVEREKTMIRDSITLAVTETVNKNIEKIREELIQKTLSETSKVLDKSLNKVEEKNDSVHSGVSCNVCGVFPIVGVRYKCTQCYDYDLCSNCENNEAHSHPLIKFRQPTVRRDNSLRLPHHFRPPHFNSFRNPFKNLFGDKFYHFQNYSSQLQDIRTNYDVRNLSDEKILAALSQTKGNIDEALALLF